MNDSDRIVFGSMNERIIPSFARTHEPAPNVIAIETSLSAIRIFILEGLERAHSLGTCHLEITRICLVVKGTASYSFVT